jgi:hypothetical protein
MSRRPFRWPEFNRRQLRVLVIGSVLLVVVLLFPPWVHEYRYESGPDHEVFAGLRFILLPPTPEATYQLYATHVDYLIVLIEVLGAIGFTWGSLRAMSDGLPRVSTHHRSFR